MQENHTSAGLGCRTLPQGLVAARHEQDRLTRSDVLQEKRRLSETRAELGIALKGKTLLPEERDALSQEARDCYLRETEFEEVLKTRYLPQHSPAQLLNPRLFFVTPLFRVASKAAPRAAMTRLELAPEKSDPIVYVGPELRQSEGFVFMALINLARDIQAGIAVRFSPKALCEALFGRYDGPTRNRLREYIRRLQLGQIQTRRYTVQLCQRFEHPPGGDWSVALDKDIVSLFSQANVWLSFQSRAEVSEGLSSWLYGYVEAQSTLIPTSVDSLRAFCGSASEGKAFVLSLRTALKELAALGVIESGFRIQQGRVHWMKKRMLGIAP